MPAGKTLFDPGLGMSQSSMSSSSFPETPPRPSRAPRLLSAVSGDKALAVASFEAGWMRVR